MRNTLLIPIAVLIAATAIGAQKNDTGAHDAITGAKAWKFYTAAGDDDPGGASWAGSPEDKRFAATWGLPGNYDPHLKLIYWGVANPTPAVMSGEGLLTGGLITQAGISPARRHNEMYVFALPDRR